MVVTFCYDKTMNIYVIRHGQTELNVKGYINGSLDDPLTPTGIEQAYAAALTLPDTIQRMYVSSLSRTRQTAAILNEVRQLPVAFSDDLQEVNFGVLNGTQFLPEHKMRHESMSYDWRPSGESFDDVKRRVLRILGKIQKENGDSEALIVAHGGIIRMLHYLEFGETLGEIKNASLSHFDIDKILA